MTANIVLLQCRDLPIKQVVIYKARAELKRTVEVSLLQGENLIHIEKLSLSTVPDSIRVDGVRNATIQEVLIKRKLAMGEQSSAMELAESRAALKSNEIQISEMDDRKAMLQRKVEVLDEMVGQMAGGVLPRGGDPSLDDVLRSSITYGFDIYDTKSAALRDELRLVKIAKDTAEEERVELRKKVKKLTNRVPVSVDVCVIVLDSKNGGKVVLDFVYQVYNCGWQPLYDLRLKSIEKAVLEITYFAKVTQNTGENWNETSLVISTAQPSRGVAIPELGNLEASIWKSTISGGGRTQLEKFEEVFYRGLTLEEDESSSELDLDPINRQEVTIGSVDVSPQLFHECVPSKSLSAFLTVSAVNTSQMPFLPGYASVYLDGSFVAKTNLKSVFPNERFKFSLGVDSLIRVEYKPAVKSHLQTGYINRTSTTVTEQVITLKNTRKEPILLTVKEQLPRSTDENVKIRVITPAYTSHEETSVVDPETPDEGVKMTAQNALEWTVKLTGGQQQILNFKYAIDFPKGQKIQINEKF